MKLTRRQLRKIIRESLWKNIHAKKKRGEKSNPRSKSYKAAKKAGEKINKSKSEQAVDEEVSESLAYHLDHCTGVDMNVHRPGSEAFFSLFREVRALSKVGLYTLNEAEEELINNSDIGEYGYYEGKRVPLDYPMRYKNDLVEADYKGRKVELNKPKRGGDDGKAYVYVNTGKKTKAGKIKVKKVSFGSSMPDAMGKSEAHRKRRKSYGARHNCADKKDKTKPGYWSCRATKFFGRNISGWW